MRLIDADEFVMRLKQNAKLNQPFVCSGDFAEGVKLALSEFQECRTIEAEPVRRGHWELLHETELERLLACSNCNEWIRFDYDAYAPYCPFCGTKMDNIDGRWPMQTEENK